MNRRGFLGSLATLAAGLAFDPERLLWVPGAKTFFLRSVAPGFVCADWLTLETLRILKNKLQFQREINRFYDAPIIGDTLRVRMPSRFR